MIRECGGEASAYVKAYAVKKPCRVCKEESEDTLDSRYGSKALGFIRGSEVYHDDEFLIWVSHKDSVKKQICFTCERDRIYAEDIERELKLRSMFDQHGTSTGSGSQKGQSA